jgi:hypothetical protein
MSTHDIPAMSRRRFLKSSAAGLGAASVARLGAPGPVPSARAAGTTSPSSDIVDAVLAAFQTHRLVGLGESHGLQNHHDALDMLLSDPKVPEVVDDIVVEFGNARYQPTIDRFIAGEPVDNTHLRAAWRNTTQSPAGTWDQPVYEQFYRTVRAINWTLPARKRMRVLLGDPPINWPKIKKPHELQVFLRQRDTHAAAVVENEVLNKGHRALLCYGGEHLMHSTPNLVSTVERRTGERTYTIVDLLPDAGDPGGLARSLSPYARDTVTPTAGTWLGSFDAGLLVQAVSGVTTTGRSGGKPPKPSNPLCGVPLGSLIDAGLYVGQPEDLTASWWNPAIYLDPAYWKELQRRNAIQGNPIHLDSYRREQPDRYPLTSLPSGQQCRVT